ncbi:MAG: hypothetical protein M3R12_08725, partial [Actinomycetota bacterium]|nr:hypothetical protein [Actinomycetota bacterium]
MGVRILGFVVILVVLGASAYTFVGKARSGKLDPVSQVDAAASRGELASAQYVLGIVSGQLAQTKVLSGSYGGVLEFDKFPLVTLVRADESSYCLEFEKSHT